MTREASCLLPQICHWYTMGLQFGLGGAAPCLYWICNDARAAMLFAERERISPDNSTYRMYHWLCRNLCSWQRALYWLLAATLVTLATCASACLHFFHK